MQVTSAYQKNYFSKFICLIYTHKLQPKDIFNIDMKGFIIGMSLKAKLICQRGRWPPWVTQDATREILTVIQCCYVVTLELSCNRSVREI